MTIQQVLESIHDRHILSNVICYALNVAIPIKLVVNMHIQTFCNVNSLNINTVYANYWIIDHLSPTYYHKISI